MRTLRAKQGCVRWRDKSSRRKNILGGRTMIKLGDWDDGNKTGATGIKLSDDRHLRQVEKFS